jgi:hypothetical protein
MLLLESLSSHKTIGHELHRLKGLNASFRLNASAVSFSSQEKDPIKTTFRFGKKEKSLYNQLNQCHPCAISVRKIATPAPSFAAYVCTKFEEKNKASNGGF